ncbi:MAG: (deoxy)nucleoside triphosphate pyrophosphohydrolase [Desulfovibrio sp.]|nr:(deoxy)nucleoside triphosphate pyrophosphohydrolase [Desulfovibrio sp.]
MEKKHITVVAAVLRKGEQILATQRGYGEFKDLWEFPGGKIEEGEGPKEALVREIREELAIDIKVGELLMTVHYEYPAFFLTMHCYWCRMPDETPQLLEHEAAAWLSANELQSVNWLPADIEVTKKIEQSLKDERATSAM